MRTATSKAMVLACGAAAAVLGTPRESRAIFDWLHGCCKAPTTYNAAVAGYNPCNPCGQQTVNYVPQTCYRTQYVSVPVTTFRPVTSCDPCTGCPTTCMRPVVTYVQQARRIPYASFRLVYSNPCATQGYSAGYGGVSAAAYSGGAGTCSQCNAGASYAPTTEVPYYTPPASGASTIAPSLPANTGSESSGAGAPSTFESSTPAAEDRLKPIPDPGLDGEPRSETPTAPQLIDPESRTTRYPIQRAVGFRSVSRPERTAAKPAATTPDQPATRPAANDGDWRPSQR